jgi:hypothetical protein
MRRRRRLIDARDRAEPGRGADAQTATLAAEVEPSSVPLFATLLLGIASSAAAALIWEFGVIQCGSESLVASGGACSRHHLVLLPLLALLAGPVGAVIGSLRQKWWPLVAGCAVALVPSLVTALFLWL